MKHVRFKFEPTLANLLPPSSPINWTSGSAAEGENVIKNHLFRFRVELSGRGTIVNYVSGVVLFQRINLESIKSTVNPARHQSMTVSARGVTNLVSTIPVALHIAHEVLHRQKLTNHTQINRVRHEWRRRYLALEEALVLFPHMFNLRKRAGMIRLIVLRLPSSFRCLPRASLSPSLSTYQRLRRERLDSVDPVCTCLCQHSGDLCLYAGAMRRHSRPNSSLSTPNKRARRARPRRCWASTLCQ